MDIKYLNQNLLELNLRVREAFSHASGLAKEQMNACRWIAMNMPCPSSKLSAIQKELIARLEDAIEYAREYNLENVVGWCMVATQNEKLELDNEDANHDMIVIRPIISGFLDEHLPPPATVLDVASGTGRFSRPLAAQGYEISLFEPADSFLKLSFQKAESEGIERNIHSLTCGTFKDLAELETDSYDLCLCLRSLFYAHPREQAEQILFQLGRIASKVVVVDVISKYGIILQLGAEFDVSANAIRQILTTGNTPPAKPEHGRVIYSCFSSNELHKIAQTAELNIQRLVGFGITETLELGTPELISINEVMEIETLLQNQAEMIDTFPNLLALCLKHRQSEG